MQAPPGKRITLAAYPTDYHDKLTKPRAGELLSRGVEQLAQQQDLLYAQNRYALLVIIQGLDASGKDGIVKHVMSGLNPQGCQVTSFKAPSQEELEHDFLWRCAKALPRRGQIGIFNRSYYEEVLAVRVHPQLLGRQNLPGRVLRGNIWRRRYEQINNFEQYLAQNGTEVIKLFLHISRAEQKRRFLERIDQPEKNWKFSRDDANERRFWPDYQRAYQDMLNATSTPWAPWYVLPADHKWFTRLAAAEIVIDRLKRLKPAYPKLSPRHRRELSQARKALEKEQVP